MASRNERTCDFEGCDAKTNDPHRDEWAKVIANGSDSQVLGGPQFDVCPRHFDLKRLRGFKRMGKLGE